MATEFTELVDAVVNKDDDRCNEILSELRPVIIRFLSVHYSASHEDAEDCTQNTLMIALEKIRNHQLSKPESILSYLFTTAKRELLNMNRYYKEMPAEDGFLNGIQSPEQLMRLIDKEKYELLQLCVEEMDDKSREFIQYCMEYPGHSASLIADHFSVSVGSVWTRKHRIIKKLQQCISKKTGISL